MLKARLAPILAAVVMLVAAAPVHAQLREYLNSPAAAAESAASRAVVEHVAEQLDSLRNASPARYCGTGLVQYIHEHLHELSTGARAAVTAALPGAVARPTIANEEFFDSPTAPFRIHFTRSGPDSVRNASTDTAADGIPTYVHVADQSLTHAYELLTDSLGFPPQLSDGTVGGGTDLYDVYLARPGGLSFVIAFTAPESLYVRIFNGTDSVYVATSFEVVHPTMEPFSQLANRLDLLRITCAHEFFHAIHYSMDAFEKPDWQAANWWQEGCSTWFEDYAFPNVNDWTNIGPYMDKPWESIMTSQYLSSLHPYGGGSIWCFYLTQRYGGPDILRKIWEQCGRVPGDNTLDATADSLAPYGVTLDQAWAQFSNWCMRTGTHWDDSSFTQGADWPEPAHVRSYYDYPQAALLSDGSDTLGSLLSGVPIDNVSNDIPAKQLEGLAFLPVAYIPFPTVSDSMQLFAAAKPGLPVSFFYGGHNQVVYPNRIDYKDIPSYTAVTAHDWLDYDSLFMVAVSGAHFDTSITWGLSGPDTIWDTSIVIASSTPVIMAALDTKAAANETITFAPPYPNPVYTSEGQAAEFELTLLSTHTIRLDIFTLSGDLVRSIVKEKAISAVAIFWDGKNDAGKLVASGLYLCRLKVGATEEVYRVGIIR